MTIKPHKCSLFSTLTEPSVSRKDLQALTLVGPPRDNLEPDPLAVLNLDNQVCIYDLMKRGFLLR